MVVDLDGFADRPRIGAEGPPPGTVAEHGGARTARAIDRRLEGAPEQRRHAEHVEVVGRHLDSEEEQRIGALPVEDEGVAHGSAQLLEAVTVTLVIEQVARRGRREEAAGFVLAKHHYLAAGAVGEGAQEHGVDDAEDGGVGADS